MEKVTFSSCKPYLQICVDGSFIIFSGDSTYTSRNEAEIKSLREYAERYKSSYIIAEDTEPAELRKKYEELEAIRIQEAEARQEAKLEAEKKRKADHELYSLLRMV